MKKTLTNNICSKRVIALMLSCMLCLSLFMSLNMNVAFCDGEASEDNPFSEVTTAIDDAAKSVYGLLRSIVAPIAAVMFAWAGLQFFFGGKGGTEAARKIIWGSIFGILLVALAPFLVSQVAQMGTEFTWDDLKNPLGS